MILIAKIHFLKPLLKYLMIICLNLVRNFRNFNNEIYKRSNTLFYFNGNSVSF